MVAAGATGTEQGIEERNINEQAQANCFEALFSTFQPEDWWAGGFMWKWFPNMRGHEGYPERDYTPQGKFRRKHASEMVSRVKRTEHLRQRAKFFLTH